jgi:hypothetical protein
MFFHDTNSVLAYWNGRPLRAREAYRVMGEYIARLRNGCALFRDLYVLDGRTYVPLRQDLTNLETELVKTIDPEHGFINDDPSDLGFTAMSFSELGFRSNFSNAPRTEHQTVSLQVKCGQRVSGEPIAPNSIILNVVPEVESPGLLRSLFEETVRFWHPADAVVTRSEVLQALGEPIREVKPGWLTYIGHKRVAEIVPADFVHEPFADGVIIQASDCPARRTMPTT